MGAFSDRAYQTARRLLTKYGQPITGKHIVVTESDVETGEVVDSAPVTYTGVGYPGNYVDGLIDGTLVERDDIRLLLATTGVPITTDVITISGKDYTALKVQIISAQGSAVVYKIQCRA